MKIAYIVSTILPSPKASTIQVMRMCEALARLGHEVMLFAAGNTAETPAEVCAYYGVEPIFRVRRVPRQDWRGGATLFQLGSLRAANLGRDGICYSRGRDYVAPVAAVALGARAVFEVHGLPASPREAGAVRRLARSPRARVVAISTALRDCYKDASFIVAPDGVDLSRFTPPLDKAEARRACGLPLDRRLVVYVGGLYAGRGVEELIEAVGTLQATSLVIVGGRNEAEVEPFRRLAAEHGVEAVFAGYRPPAEVPRWLFAADVLAMPYAESLATATGEDTARWMSPLKMFEYMAAGRPIVATGLPALREVLRPEENALLATPGNADALRAQIARLLADEALAGRLAAQARADVEDYTWEKRAERILRGWS